MRIIPILIVIVLVTMISCNATRSSSPDTDSPTQQPIVIEPSTPSKGGTPAPAVPAPDDTTPTTKPPKTQASSCTRDTDCVPASCCHATSCVSRDKQPDCTNLMCTMDCKPGSMDCGQGSCACEQNACVAKITPMDDLPQ